MDFSISFAIWAIIMVVIIGLMARTARRQRSVDERLEQSASDALPEIGEVADHKHQQTFGRSSTHPVGGWYPPAKRGRHSSPPPTKDKA